MNKPHLILGPTGQVVTPQALENYVPPQRTASHVPVHHHDLYEMAKRNLYNSSWSIEEEILAIDNNHSSLILFTITDQLMHGSPHVSDEFTTTCGFINNNIKKSSVKGFEGVRYHMCMNLQSDGVQKLSRKHTANIMNELNDQIMLFTFKIRENYGDRLSRVNHYKNTILSNRDTDHILMEGVRRNIVSHGKIPAIATEAVANSDEHRAEQGSAYLLNQAFTRIIGNRPTNALHRTAKLTELMDEKTGFTKKTDSPVYQTFQNTDPEQDNYISDEDVPF